MLIIRDWRKPPLNSNAPIFRQNVRGVVGMRCELLTLFKGFSSNSILAIGCAGLLLAGCSSSIDRFADYPGRNDGTHTASVPSRSGAAASDDYIESSTLTGAPKTSAGSNPYKAPVRSEERRVGKECRS